MNETLDMRGHNLPTDDQSALNEMLLEKAQPLLRRRDDLIAAANRVPPTIKDDETAGRFADYIKSITACMKSLESMRTGEKEPFLQAGRTVDGFFKKLTDPLAAAKKHVESILTTWQRQKAEEERLRRMEAERLAREEAERAARAAAEAEAKIKTEADLSAAVVAEQAAVQARADAEKAKREAEAKAAELNRARGDYGALASLRTFWDFADLDRASLDLEALRNHIPWEGLEKAVRSFVKAGGRELRGVRIFENTTSVVR